MPNLVRVRGKRHNRRDVKARRNLVTVGNPIKKAKIHHEKSKISQMESLPTEILQEIFILCPNFALPNASMILYQKLTSDHVKSSLVMRYFSNAQLIEGSSGNMVPRHWQDMLSESTHDPEYLDHGELQSTILRAPWMNYEFMRRCSWKFQMQNAKKQLDHFLRDDSREERDAQVSLLLRRITNHFNRFESRVSKDDPDHWSGEYEYTRKDGLIFKWHVDAIEAECSLFRLYIDDPTYVLADLPTQRPETRRYDRRAEQMKATHLGYTMYQFPYVAHDCQLPTSLLQGAWTQDRGDLVKTLLDAKAIAYRGKSWETLEDMVEITDDIIACMISEKSIEALFYFISTYMRRDTFAFSSLLDDPRQGFILRYGINPMGPTLLRLHGFHPIRQPPTYLSEARSNVNSDGMTLLPPSNFPWEIIKGPRPRLVRDDLMTIRQEHLTMCLQLVDSTGDEDFLTLFFWLTRVAAEQDVSTFEQLQKTIQPKLKVNADGSLNDESVYFRAWLWLKGNLDAVDGIAGSLSTDDEEFRLRIENHDTQWLENRIREEEERIARSAD